MKLISKIYTVSILCLLLNFYGIAQDIFEDSSDLSLIPREFPQRMLKPQTATLSEFYLNYPQLNFFAPDTLVADSVIYQVFQRNLHLWRKTVLVCDWTESMYPYGVQVLFWINHFAQSKEAIQDWVFFNDGDDKTIGEKVIGRTRGIYAYHGNDLGEILALMEQVKRAGQGDDAPENDLEALLYAQAAFPESGDLILIADAHSEIRDLMLVETLAPLLKKKNIQLHIILCGIEKGISYDYLLLARIANASLHTNKEDWDKMGLWEEGREIQLGKTLYRLKDGQFQIVYPSKKKRRY